jgi:hypothetical protein
MFDRQPAQARAIDDPDFGIVLAFVYPVFESIGMLFRAHYLSALAWAGLSAMLLIHLRWGPPRRAMRNWSAGMWLNIGILMAAGLSVSFNRPGSSLVLTAAAALASLWLGYRERSTIA